ncbi:hypothetical protein HZ326_4234 [Fusarium oxysporum f. sp. albedinis]|nr:hypothetical protein HZ326_4234 [Fusarium oxysporum f. sp. albedinis]
MSAENAAASVGLTDPVSPETSVHSCYQITNRASRTDQCQSICKKVRVIMHTNITGGSSIITSSRIFTNNSRHSGQCLDRMEDQSLNLDLLLIVN